VRSPSEQRSLLLSIPRQLAACQTPFNFDRAAALVGNCRLAYGVMLMERDKLIAMHGTTDHSLVDKMMAELFQTAEWLKATAHMVEAAYVRVLASAAAAATQGVKFKGVDYKPVRGKAVQS
jgi:hypothetical protein